MQPLMAGGGAITGYDVIHLNGFAGLFLPFLFLLSFSLKPSYWKGNGKETYVEPRVPT